MGGAIARGLAQGHCVNVQDIIVTNPSTPKLEKLKTEFPEICVSTNNEDAGDADIVIDVRFLPNPFYIPELRGLTGLDKPVSDYVLGRDETHKFLDAWDNLLRCVMPGYVAEGKQHLAIGVGCTGGQHRSVVLAEKTAALLCDLGYNVRVYHRDIALADTSKEATK